MSRLDEIFGECDGLIAAPPEGVSQRLSDAIDVSLGVHGVHDLKSVRADAETACECIYGNISPKEMALMINPTLHERISNLF